MGLGLECGQDPSEALEEQEKVRIEFYEMFASGPMSKIAVIVLVKRGYKSASR